MSGNYEDENYAGAYFQIFVADFHVVMLIRIGFDKATKTNILFINFL